MSHALLLTQDRNRLASATFVASSVRPSRAVSRLSVDRRGNGVLGLTGAYTGDVDTVYDLEVVAGSTPRATKPNYVGIGSGMLSVDVAIGAINQDIDLECTLAGITEVTAWTVVEGVKILAKSKGEAGNRLTIEIDDSGLVFEITTFSSLVALKTGETSVAGQSGLDWDTVSGTPDRVPVNAKRVCINGDHASIYRQWKSYEDGKWTYHFLPAFTRDYPEGAKVEFVTGSCSVTLTDGVNTETYPGIISGYDMLAAIRDHSTLATIEGVVSDDPTPDNLLAAIDLRTRTTALLLWNKGSGSKYATGFDPFEVLPHAKTEIITAECIAATAQENAGVGREKWSVKGSVSGDLGILSSGESITRADEFSLTIPSKYPPGWGTPRGRLSSKINLASRGQSDTPVAICVDRLRTGPNAKDGSYTFTYKKRPTGECNCNDQEYKKLPSLECLGLVDPNNMGGGSDMIPAVQTRLVALTEWLRGFSMTNTRVEGEMPDSPAYVRYAGDLGDLLAAENVSRLLASTLNDIGESPDALAVWDQCFAQVQTDFADLGDTSAPLPTARYFKVFQSREITGISGDIRRPSNATGYLIHFKPNVVTPTNEPYWNTWKSYRVFRT
ncbi:hypothetical protein CCP4SC76_3940003 [Gammaproteobacteria bacterium]